MHEPCCTKYLIILSSHWPLTYRRYRQRNSHGHTDKEGGQEDLRKEAFGVSLGTVESFDDEAVELTQSQPPALQLKAALTFQHLWLRG